MDMNLGSGPVSFCWDSTLLGHASHVEVTGSFNNWDAPGLELRKYADGFFLKVGDLGNCMGRPRIVNAELCGPMIPCGMPASTCATPPACQYDCCGQHGFCSDFTGPLLICVIKEFCLPPGLHQYKFIADGEWRIDQSMPRY